MLCIKSLKVFDVEPKASSDEAGKCGVVWLRTSVLDRSCRRVVGRSSGVVLVLGCVSIAIMQVVYSVVLLKLMMGLEERVWQVKTGDGDGIVDLCTCHKASLVGCA